MKKFFTIFFAALFALGCSDGWDGVPQIEKVTPIADGVLDFSQMTLSVYDMSEVVQNKSGYATRSSEDLDNYNVQIISDKDSITIFDGSYAELQSLGQLNATPGVYNITVRSHENITKNGWGEPQYGASRTVTLLSEQTTCVSGMECMLSNIKVTLNIDTEAGDRFLADELTDTPLTVVVAIGEKSVTFARDEERAAYFDVPSGDMTLSLSGMYNISEQGEEAEYVLIKGYKEVVEGVYSGQWRCVTLNANGDFEVDLEFGFNVNDWEYDDALDIK